VTEWDLTHGGALSQEQLSEGLARVMPRPDMGGPGPGRGAGPGGGFGPGGPGGPERFAELGGSWSTPVVVSIGGRDELIQVFPGRVVGYDPRTGKQLWISKGLGGAIYTTPIWGDGAIVATSTGIGSGEAVALRPGGSGDVTESHRIWRLDRIGGQIGSGVIHEGHVYMHTQEGIAVCHSLETGKTVWEKRLRGSETRGGTWSSMLLANGRIYLPNQAGDVFVLRASPQFELLATNSVNEFTNASLAASDGELLLRTNEALWCIAE
jgi:outer membrane protein assembly factor BamB